MQTQGRRVHDHDEFWAASSVYWRWDTEEGDGIYVRWMVRPPCGHHFMLAGGSQDPPHHHVEEHEDGTISVVWQPDNTNSILCPMCGWHGYLKRGVWETV